MPNERAAFLAHLAANEDDEVARFVYADWLEERGEYEEAERQRKYPAARRWLLDFADEHNLSLRDQEWHETVIDYDALLALGHEAREGDDYSASCGNNMRMMDALNEAGRAFWTNWSVLTGVPVDLDKADEGGFSCGC